MAASQWAHAVLTVSIIEMSEDRWVYEARAWSGREEIYHQRFEDMYWSGPLEDLGQDGWELVGVTTENALMGSWVKGWHADTSRPVKANFFLKRELITEEG